MVLGSPLPPKRDMSNPFATDVFDPLKHMQLDSGLQDGKAGSGSGKMYKIIQELIPDFIEIQ